MLFHVWWIVGLCWSFFLTGARMPSVHETFDVFAIGVFSLIEGVLWPLAFVVRAFVHAFEEAKS